jgi:hypothetical protein
LVLLMAWAVLVLVAWVVADSGYWAGERYFVAVLVAARAAWGLDRDAEESHVAAVEERCEAVVVAVSMSSHQVLHQSCHFRCS